MRESRPQNDSRFTQLGQNTSTYHFVRVKAFFPLLRMYTKLITRIETTCTRLGKDDKLQLFICLASHDRLLGRIVTDLTRAIAAQQVQFEHLVIN